MLIPRVPSPSSPGKGLYNPKAFVTHAASLDQACAHCPRFPTAASRRSLGRVSVPVWPIVLSDRLPIAGTVGRYPAVYLIGRGPIPGRGRNPSPSRGVPGISRGFPRLSRAPGQVPTRYSPVRRWWPKPPARLACVKRAASVRSEPGSNSQLQPRRPRARGPRTGRNARMLRDRKAGRRRPPAPAAAGRARRGRPRRPARADPPGRNRAAPTRAARPSLPRYTTMSKNAAERTIADRLPFGAEARPTAPLRSRRAGTGAAEASSRPAPPNHQGQERRRPGTLRNLGPTRPRRTGGRHNRCLPRPVQGADFTAFRSPREPGSAPPRQARSQPRGAAAGRRARRSPASGPSARRTAPGRRAGRRSGCR